MSIDCAVCGDFQCTDGKDDSTVRRVFDLTGYEIGLSHDTCAECAQEFRRRLSLQLSYLSRHGAEATQ